MKWWPWAVAAERVRAFTAFRADVASGSFPDESEVGKIDASELKRFVDSLDDAD